ncbi:hypothetical protein Acear_1403 [Acetohalobium arabaticum DSM 5501]|uniref:Uncharacterized protein n=1 Tax=Acetohalobium arabaticum (strain ATCC 49924 / DSM 5501 / Z-7288) TaxID=574087 RepID=D9QQX2_ACEAZ|nr:hypothetical protein Acear_1403 [Acetohalobium arabaticum DSM 5501]
MFKIKDKYSLGILAGLIANIIRTVFNYIAYYFNLSELLGIEIPSFMVACFYGSYP